MGSKIMSNQDKNNMREIKFRAWVKNEDLFGIKTKEKYPKGHMFIGFGLSDIDKGYDEANAWCENDRWEEPDFEKAVIMQFTGLKDKNGKEIYEGDILQDTEDPEPLRYRIVWVEDGAKFEIETLVDEEGNWDTYIVDELCQQVGGQNKIPDLEIIGNIYENPELLK